MITFNIFAKHANISNNLVKKKPQIFYLPIKMVDSKFFIYILHPHIKLSDVNYPRGEILEQVTLSTVNNIRAHDINDGKNYDNKYPYKYFSIDKDTLEITEIEESIVNAMRNV